MSTPTSCGPGMGRLLLTFAVLAAITCQAQPEPRSTEGSTEEEQSATQGADAINTFLKGHGELGTVISIEPAPDWARGERRRVRLTSGSYLFYFYEDRVVTIYRDDEDSRVEVYREEIPNAATPVAEGERPMSEALPVYEILDSVETLNEGTMADILVSSFSKGTSVVERESFAQAVASKEGLEWVTLYCSRDAFRANYSSSFSESHPDALETCYLGSWKRGQGLTP